MTASVAESTVEEAALAWLEGLGYTVLNGQDIAPDTPAAERAAFGDIVLHDRLRSALIRINPFIPAAAIEDAVRKVTRIDAPNLLEANHSFHHFLADGVDVEFNGPDGSIVYGKVWFLDFASPDANDWLVVNQFTVIEHKHNRRPDIVLFVNGLPLAVIELKDATDEQATIRKAFNQLQTYKQEIPSLFVTNELLVISDGLEARAGTLTSDWEWFPPWRTTEGEDVSPKGSLELEVLLKGIFQRDRFLDLVRHFVLYEIDGQSIEKKMAAYHQYHAVNRAVCSTIEATSQQGDRRAGVVWHTQGSGKSHSMAFYAGKIIAHPAMENPTLVVLTDRNDLDDQLFGTFALAHELLHQAPQQAESRDHLRELLQVASGGVVFTTIQKFLPDEKGAAYRLLSDRRNIVVIADEAHRSQYDFIDGFARRIREGLPNATFIGFTGTPIEVTDRNTKAVFGDYVDVYDIQQAVEDGATVPIYYEGRLAKIDLDPQERPLIDEEFEEVTEGEESERKEKLKSKWARLEAMLGTEERINLIAQDIVQHFEQRQEAMEGKGMIVCMSRRIAVDLYNAITALRPDWHDSADERGKIKVVMTGSASDPVAWQGHIRNGPRRKALANRFKNPDDPFQLVIVRDMWLTGFEMPASMVQQ